MGPQFCGAPPPAHSCRVPDPGGPQGPLGPQGTPGGTSDLPYNSALGQHMGSQRPLGSGSHRCMIQRYCSHTVVQWRSHTGQLSGNRTAPKFRIRSTLVAGSKRVDHMVGRKLAVGIPWCRQVVDMLVEGSP